MSYESILLTHADGIATVTLNQPARVIIFTGMGKECLSNRDSENTVAQPCLHCSGIDERWK